MLAIGHELIISSRNMPGHFEEWLRLEFSISRASAYDYMNAAAKFESVPKVFEALPAATVYKLAANTTPAEVAMRSCVISPPASLYRRKKWRSASPRQRRRLLGKAGRGGAEEA